VYCAADAGLAIHPVVQLTSVDRRTTIEITQAAGGGAHAPYRLRVECGPGGFVGESDDVHFLDVDGFKAKLNAFLATRQGSVVLRSTDDCQLEFFRQSARGDIGLRYAIGRLFMEGDATEYSNIAIFGRFKLRGEFAEQMAAQLLKLLHV
jgi:hypothetical protein